ncbi:septum formation inhibitor Maf [Snuella sedimenti]|uniref:Septum formation inhibitor Maf n=1 Tax=Snuella sedimenti TaxID=2798802 RepID=A0A8J7J196_9FLAO|nr:septum formation inhibitor Maf [Snuella sedimenti]MBJ6367079.1 septum formation inhibitor Maf [Snuella sedimenti]
MQKINKILPALVISFIISLPFSCKEDRKGNTVAHRTKTTDLSTNNLKSQEISQAFKDYWYSGNAEISSYKLEQARYGEIRNGHAFLIYVTEDFLPSSQVKAEKKTSNSISILKLNATKKFTTGMYPYYIMQSTFYPVSNDQHAMKVSSSVQEWCGHVYTQLNNRELFNVVSHSYFEGEADKNFKLEKAIIENELWTQLRINPKSLPTGDIFIIPSLEYTRLSHIPIKAYSATAVLTKNNYTLSYPELNRELVIRFNPNFPHEILEWEETFNSGFGSNSQQLTTKATKLKTIKSPYWNKNSNKDSTLREALCLK